MLKRFRRNQATLLDHYWNALVRGNAERPPGIDPEQAHVTEQLVEASARLNATPAFAADLRRRLEAQAAATTEQQRRAWAGPTVGPNSHRPASSHGVMEHEEQQIMSEIDLSQPRQEPTPVHQRGWAREALKIAAAAVVFITIGVVLALILRDDDDTPAVVGPGSTPTPTTTTAPTPTVPATATAELPTATVAAVAPTVTASEPSPTPTIERTSTPSIASLEFAAEIEVGRIPNFPAFGSGSLWVPSSGGATVSRIDPATNTVVAIIPIDANPAPDPETGPYLMAGATDNAVWVVAQQISTELPTLVRIDPATNTVVQTVTLDVYPSEIVYEPASRSIWYDSLLNDDIVRLDADSGAVVARLTLGPNHTLTTLDGLVWAAGSGGNGLGTLWVIDPSTNAIVNTFEDIPNPRSIAGGAGAIWVSNWGEGGSAIVRMDPATGATVATIPVSDPGYIGAGAGAVWFGSHGSGTVVRIDPMTNAVVARYPGVRGVTFAFGADAAWVAGAYGSSAFRIDP